MLAIRSQATTIDGLLNGQWRFLEACDGGSWVLMTLGAGFGGASHRLCVDEKEVDASVLTMKDPHGSLVVA